MSGNINIFPKYNYNDIFIETGSYYGNGIMWAIESRFKKIISIEITPKYYDLCVNKFKNNHNVEIVFGDSVKKLWDIIKIYNQNITFWLDGHYTEHTTLFGDKMCPLLDELDIIKNHPLNTHTILIDDLRCWHPNNPLFSYYNFTEINLKNKLIEINSKYKISYDNGFIDNDVLVAQP